MPRMSIEIVVVAIIILIVALVVIGIFSGGIANFNSIFTSQSDDQIKKSLCDTTCANYCFMNPVKDGTAATHTWGEGGLVAPTYKSNTIACPQPCTCRK